MKNFGFRISDFGLGKAPPISCSFNPKSGIRNPKFLRGRGLQTVAFLLLLCCVAGRCFLGEQSFRDSALRLVLFPLVADDSSSSAIAGRGDLSRATFAVLLLAAAALAAIGAARSGLLTVRRTWLAGLVACFAAAGLVSALLADDKRSGLLVWLEQAALLSAALTAAHFCRDRRRWAILLSVLAAAGICMAALGLWQYFVEAPERLVGYQAYRAAPPAGDARPISVMLETRLADRAPTGYLGLANPFASLLIVLLSACAGLAADAVAAARRRWKESPPARGEVPLPTLAAILAILASAAIVVVLVLTRSRAGIAVAAVGAAAAATIAWQRHRLAAHWKKAVLVAGAAIVVLIAAVAAYGLRNDSLPGKSMTFRWFYWTASAEIIRDHPLWGVGGGNFGDAYLARRRPEAEEAVKDPHNFVLHALTQFGLAGGLPLLAVVFGVLVCLARPRGDTETRRMGDAETRRDSQGCHASPSFGEACVPQPRGHASANSAEAWHPRISPSGNRSPLVLSLCVLVATTVSVFVSRFLFGDIALSTFVVMLEAGVPAFVFAAALFLTLGVVGGLDRPATDGSGSGPILVGTGARIATAAGAAAFVLHNMTEFGLWAPGVALAFWAAAGACLGQAGGGKERDLSRARWPLAAALAAAVVAAGLLLWAPIFRKSIDQLRAASLWATHDIARAAEAAEEAAHADPLDDFAASDAARISIACANPLGTGDIHLPITRGRQWSKEAVARNPASSSDWRQAASADWFAAVPDAFRYARRPPKRDLEGEKFVLSTQLMVAQEQGFNAPAIGAALANAHYSFRKFGMSASLYGATLQDEPNSSLLRVYLGEALWRDGSQVEAAAAWRVAAERAPSGPLVDQALREMGESIARNPQDARLRLEYGRMLALAARFDRVIEQVAKAEEIDRRLAEFGGKYDPAAYTLFRAGKGPPPSTMCLGAEERVEIEMLKARAEAAGR